MCAPLSADPSATCSASLNRISESADDDAHGAPKYRLAGSLEAAGSSDAGRWQRHGLRSGRSIPHGINAHKPAHSPGVRFATDSQLVESIHEYSKHATAMLPPSSVIYQGRMSPARLEPVGMQTGLRRSSGQSAVGATSHTTAPRRVAFPRRLTDSHLLTRTAAGQFQASLVAAADHRPAGSEAAAAACHRQTSSGAPVRYTRQGSLSQLGTNRR
jgi:hypothetical protein